MHRQPSQFNCVSSSVFFGGGLPIHRWPPRLHALQNGLCQHNPLFEISCPSHQRQDRSLGGQLKCVSRFRRTCSQRTGMGQVGLVSELWFFANMLCVGDEGVYSRIEARDTPICTFVGARDWQYISYCFLPSFLFFF